MLTPKYPKPITKPTPKRVSPEEKASKPECTKTCGALSRLDPKRCTCVQVGVGPENTTFNPDTGRFDYNKAKRSMKKGGSLRRQVSIKGLRTSRKHK